MVHHSWIATRAMTAKSCVVSIHIYKGRNEESTASNRTNLCQPRTTLVPRHPHPIPLSHSTAARTRLRKMKADADAKSSTAAAASSTPVEKSPHAKDVSFHYSTVLVYSSSPASYI